MFKATLLLLLLAAAAADKPVSEPAAATYAAAPTVAQPVLELVADAEPAVEEPAVEEPAVEEPAMDEPAVEEPAVEEPAVEVPAVEESAAEEPVEEAAAAEPAVEEPAVEEPAVEEPAVAQPAVEEPAVVEEVAVEETAAAEPAVEEPLYEEGPSQEDTSYQQSSYGYQQSSYGSQQPSHGHHQPSYGKTHKPAPPACSLNSSQPWCLEDAEYPAFRIARAIALHHHTFPSLYQDVLSDTANSVERLQTLAEETYLCRSRTSYAQPLRAQNTDGKWRIIVNGVRLQEHTFTQTVRLEECLAAGELCPLVPSCYESTCLQKQLVHRFVVFDEYDHYRPFAIETFKLPSACACTLGEYQIAH